MKNFILINFIFLFFFFKLYKKNYNSKYFPTKSDQQLTLYCYTKYGNRNKTNERKNKIKIIIF